MLSIQRNRPSPPDRCRPAAASAVVELGSWVRPVLEGGRAVLLVEALGGAPGWRVAPRDVVKQH